MAQASTPFSPATNGFKFANRFEYHFSVKIPLPFVEDVDLSNVVLGLCGGMCFAALDYYKAHAKLPEYQAQDEIDQKLLVYLCERQLQSLSIPVLFKIFEWMMLEDADLASRMTRYEIPKLRRQLDRGEPAVLVLIRARGLDNPTKNHQVLATGYTFDEAHKALTIRLYDPNHPGQTPCITLNLKRPNAQGGGTQGGAASPFLTESTGEDTRGFFLSPYQYQPSLPQPPGPAAPAFGAPGLAFDVAEPTIQLYWPVDSTRVNQRFGENKYNYAPFGLPGHEGVDFYAPDGANVYACADGEVYEAGHPSDHPYGLHIRIVHQAGTVTYRTIYAHLKQIFVRPGQKVAAGEKIGLADNTGNSFGSHLHLTLKIDGMKTPGYPDGIVNPMPYLEGAVTVTPPPPVDEPKPEPVPDPSGVTVYTTSQVNLRAKPSTSAEILGQLPAGEALMSLGVASEINAKIGKQEQWIQVKTASGKVGWVAAWYLAGAEPFPPSDLIVYPDDKINMRSGAATTFAIVATLQPTDALTVLGDADIARAKIGKQGQWIQAQTPTGLRGFVAAWLVHLTGQAAPATDLVVYATDTINVRARPSTDSSVLTRVTPTDALTVLGDAVQAKAEVGQQGQWLNVRTPNGFTGYAAAWLVALPATTPVPPPAPTDGLVVYPTSDLNMRAQASTNSPKVAIAAKGEALTVIETDLAAAAAKIGKQGQWIYAQRKDGKTRGYVAAWYLRK